MAVEALVVVGNDIAVSANAAVAVVAGIEAAGGQPVFEPEDVSDERAVEAMVGHVREGLGRVKVRLCSACILRNTSFAKMSMDDVAMALAGHL
ncbi:MAG: SDR family oxidoreductase [Planctomycetes bacterium]|nr:SDR family oxidoreductase [Planctomycetota bacterium]